MSVGLTVFKTRRYCTLGICYLWNSSTLATSCEELTHWKRLWCWEGLGTGGEGKDRGWDGWMALLTRWTWVWVNSGSCWWTGRPGVLRFMGLQRVGHDWATDLFWSEWIFLKISHVHFKMTNRFKWNYFHLFSQGLWAKRNKRVEMRYTIETTTWKLS